MYAQSELIPRHDQSNRHTRRARRRYATLSSSIEPLELRVMLAASISGTIFEDLTWEPPSGKKVLAQTGPDSTDYRFPLCLLKDFSAKDVEWRFGVSWRVSIAAPLTWGMLGKNFDAGEAGYLIGYEDPAYFSRD